MPTIDQIRAARALLNWSQGDLADRAGLSQTGVARIESGINMPNSSTLDKITSAFDDAGIEFIADRGVERRRGDIRMYQGQDGFHKFYDDIYETVKISGGEILINNVREELFGQWLGDEKISTHRLRMKELNNFKMRVLIKEGDLNFAVSFYAEYRWTPKEYFENVSFYLYGKKLAFVIFDAVPEVYVINHGNLSEAYKKQFNLLWKESLKPDVTTLH